MIAWNMWKMSWKATKPAWIQLQKNLKFEQIIPGQLCLIQKLPGSALDASMTVEMMYQYNPSPAGMFMWCSLHSIIDKSRDNMMVKVQELQQRNNKVHNTLPTTLPRRVSFSKRDTIGFLDVLSSYQNTEGSVLNNYSPLNYTLFSRHEVRRWLPIKYNHP